MTSPFDYGSPNFSRHSAIRPRAMRSRIESMSCAVIAGLIRWRSMPNQGMSGGGADGAA